MSIKTAGLNSPEAKLKREQTLARKKAVEETDQKMMAIAKAIPDGWAEEDEQKLSLIKSIYQDILGTYVVKENNVEKVMNRPLADLRYFLFLASQRNLNPFKGQLHAVYIWNSKSNSEELVPITGIDGFASLAQRTNRYAGLSQTEFEYYQDDHDQYAGLPKCAIVDIFAYNPVTGAREAVVRATVWWEEYAKYKEKWEYNPQSKKKEPTGIMILNSTWKNRPKGQLEKCAQALAFRRAFPEETGGLYVKQEVDRLTQIPEVVESDVVDAKASTKDEINEALKARKAEGKSVANGDIPEPSTPLYEVDNETQEIL